MGKAVLISIRPEFCSDIIIGKKTLEIRKNKPKLQRQFKCYIYCTKTRYGWLWFDSPNFRRDGYVIGEFICDSVRRFDVPYPAFQAEMDKDILEMSCLSYYQLHRYAFHDSLFGWHISNLKIYDKPIGIGNFNYACDKNEDTDCTMCAELGFLKCKPVARPPQSWCYVEEVRWV